MQPGPAPLTKPTPPEFKPRRQIKVGYYMSITVGWFGQVLFLGSWFGGGYWYAAAAGAAAFAEVVMSASGNASLDHRVHGRAWKLMLALSLTVAGYAAANQLLHWHNKPALAITFAGASVIGFFLHLLDGHIRAAAYLRALAQWQAAEAAAPSVPATQQPARRPAPRPAAKPAPKAAETTATAPTAPASTTVDAPMPVPDPVPPTAGSGTGPQGATNVRPISEGLSQREQAYQWFAEQVRARGGDPRAVEGPDIAKQFGVPHLAKKISEFRQRWHRENPAAVNE
jgi:hypothetical protein